jgi:Rrf2 family transcriptional regulator, iron-sulfur cluster assembly transcription factor
MLWSSACDYAIRAIAHLASRPDALVQLKTIARDESIPAPFVGKILQSLVRAGILRSVKGPRGGYGLARAPHEITLFTVRAAVDGTRDLEACAVGMGPCSDDLPCPLHDAFKPIRLAIRRYLEQTTLAEMSTALSRKRALLAKASRPAAAFPRPRRRLDT